MESRQKKFRNVSLMASLVDEIQEKHVRPNGPYRSNAEFVAEAARLRLEALERRAPIVRDR